MAWQGRRIITSGSSQWACSLGWHISYSAASVPAKTREWQLAIGLAQLDGTSTISTHRFLRRHASQARSGLAHLDDTSAIMPHCFLRGPRVAARTGLAQLDGTSAIVQHQVLRRHASGTSHCACSTGWHASYRASAVLAKTRE